MTLVWIDVIGPFWRAMKRELYAIVWIGVLFLKGDGQTHCNRGHLLISIGVATRGNYRDQVLYCQSFLYTWIHSLVCTCIKQRIKTLQNWMSKRADVKQLNTAFLPERKVCFLLFQWEKRWSDNIERFPLLKNTLKLKWACPSSLFTYTAWHLGRII